MHEENHAAGLQADVSDTSTLTGRLQNQADKSYTELFTLKKVYEITPAALRLRCVGTDQYLSSHRDGGCM